jgi:uncharacterized Zn-finger protein
MQVKDKGQAVELLASELNSQGGVFCPNPSMVLWSSHPRVYLNVAETGSVRCPYCGTVYRLKDGEHFHPHH